jgi:hypothetical protein
MTGDRVYRSRHAELADVVDRLTPGQAGGTARLLVQIYDGGSIPTTPDHYYLAHPVGLDGAEVEGGVASPTADSSQTVVVDVLGHAPSVGDILMAYAVGGRWVAEKGVGQKSNCCKFACGPCKIYKQDLTFAWTGGNLIAGSTMLKWQAGGSLLGSWQSDCIDNFFHPPFPGAPKPNFIFAIDCLGGGVTVKIYEVTPPPLGGPTGLPAPCNNALALTPLPSVPDSPGGVKITETCDPYKKIWTCPALGDPCVSFANTCLTWCGCTFTLSTTAPPTDPPGLMCQLFKVVCNGGSAVKNAVVSVFDHVGGTLKKSGTTSASGQVFLFWEGGSGTFYITTTAAGFVDYGASRDLVCDGTTTVKLDSDGTTWLCCVPCNLPLADLTLSWTSALVPIGNGSLSIAYDDTIPGWEWTVGADGDPDQIVATLTCAATNVQLQVEYTSTIDNKDKTCVLVLNSFTCDPLVLTYFNFSFIHSCPGIPLYKSFTVTKT